MSEAAFQRAAREGDGFIGGAVPPEMSAPSFDAARAAWTDAGRTAPPRLVAVSYVGIGDLDKARANVYDYYRATGDELAALVSGGVAGGVDAIRQRIAAFGDLGVDEPGLCRQRTENWTPTEVRRL